MYIRLLTGLIINLSYNTIHNICVFVVKTRTVTKSNAVMLILQDLKRRTNFYTRM